MNLRLGDQSERRTRRRQKIASHVGFWTHFRNPETRHLLVVLPTDAKEGRVQRAILLGVNLKADKPLCPEETTLRLRTPVNGFRGTRRTPGIIDNCIGKPHWWERRPGGGEAA